MEDHFVRLVGDRPQEGPEVDGHVECRFDLRCQVVPAEEPAGELQVTARRDGKELREPLDDAEHDRVQDLHGQPAPPPRVSPSITREGTSEPPG